MKSMLSNPVPPLPHNLPTNVILLRHYPYTTDKNFLLKISKHHLLLSQVMAMSHLLLDKPIINNQFDITHWCRCSVTISNKPLELSFPLYKPRTRSSRKILIKQSKPFLYLKFNHYKLKSINKVGIDYKLIVFKSYTMIL